MEDWNKFKSQKPLPLKGDFFKKNNLRAVVVNWTSTDLFL
jgi:hypothetical protein